MRILLILALLAALAALGSTVGSGATGKPQLVYVPASSATPTEQQAQAAMRREARSLGVDLSIVGGQFDPNAQLAAVNSVLQRQFDGFVIWPIDPKGIRPSLDRIAAKKVPIVVLDSPSSRPYTVNFNLPDYATEYQIARYAAAKVKALKQPCNVGVIEGPPVVEILNARNQGLVAGAKSAGCT